MEMDVHGIKIKEGRMESDQPAAMRWSPSIISHYKHRATHTLGENELAR